jgi:hypothetical protein
MNARATPITAAYLEWNAEVADVALYRTHIPGWEQHNRYRRMDEEKRLMARSGADAGGKRASFSLDFVTCEYSLTALCAVDAPH